MNATVEDTVDDSEEIIGYDIDFTRLYKGHHYYGHVQDVQDVDLVKWIILVPLLIVGIALLVAVPALLLPIALAWAFWPEDIAGPGRKLNG